MGMGWERFIVRAGVIAVVLFTVLLPVFVVVHELLYRLQFEEPGALPVAERTVSALVIYVVLFTWPCALHPPHCYIGDELAEVLPLLPYAAVGSIAWGMVLAAAWTVFEWLLGHRRSQPQET